MDDNKKSTIKEMLSKVKDLLSSKSDNEPQKFFDGTLADGTTKVKSEGEVLTVGVILYVVTPEGDIPAPAGEHQLDTGEVVSVSEGGVIEEIKTQEDEMKKPEEMSNEKIQSLEKEVGSLKEAVASLGSRLEASQSKFDSQKTEIEKQKTAFSKLLEIVEGLAAAPASTPAVEPTRTTLSKQDNYYTSLAKQLESLKN